MTMKDRIVRYLLRAYPGDWRKEYGDELTAVLEAAPLRLRVVVDVLRNGLSERVHNAEVWQIGGVVLALGLIAGTAVNSLKAFSNSAYNLFWQLEFCIAFFIGYLSVSRDGKTRFAAAAATGKAMLLGIVPELFLAMLWTAGLIHPTILRMDGIPSTMGHGITDLCIRTEAAVTPAHLLMTPFASGIPGMIAGAIGGSIAQFVSAFREGFRRSSN